MTYAAEAVTSIDKLDKIGPEKVIAEMTQRGIEGAAANKLLGLFARLEGLSNAEVLVLIAGFTNEATGVRRSNRKNYRIAWFG